LTKFLPTGGKRVRTPCDRLVRGGERECWPERGQAKKKKKK